ncbi:hypothetical protein [Leucobacter sp. L43]|uniref:hypothetical protein n=1 Tax=Leucobacter sp. L43 TaxID=2798040 RepID=UPI0019063B59|nr:hypothetical protein [Leucobacter sp. L43]
MVSHPNCDTCTGTCQSLDRTPWFGNRTPSVGKWALRTLVIGWPIFIAAWFIGVPGVVAYAVFLAALLAGLVLAVVSLARRERPSWAAWTMGLIAATPILLAALAATFMSIAAAMAGY